MTGFLLSQSGQTLRTHGALNRYNEVRTAAQAIRDGQARFVVGALPFDPRTPAALVTPESATFSHGPFRPDPLPALPAASLIRETPDLAEHLARVAELVSLIRDGTLRKVVAARSVLMEFEAPIDPMVLAGHLIARNPATNGFVANLTSAGRAGATLVGASPEVLVAKHGAAVSLRPLAGTAPRQADPAADHAQGEALLASTKNQEEHAYVIEWIRERLGPVCRELSIPSRPQLIRTPEVWHLASPIAGVLRDPATTVLDVAALLHPTPAVCGVPAQRALDTIVRTEGDRGFYGGAVGWCDEHGDGEWIVAIRCVELDAGGRGARAFAGGGIVASSDPQLELDETKAKLRTVLGAFGVREDPADAAAGTLGCRGKVA